MNCRKCNQKLEEGLPFCPACGTDNSIVEETVPEKPKRQLWKPIVAAVCLIAVVADIAAAVLLGGGSFGESGGVTSVASYTKADDIVIENADAIVARAGDLELTNGELQVIYWSMVYEFLEYYGDYVYYYNLMDFEKSLSVQYYDEEAGVTWQHYFLDLALQSWVRYEVLCVEAEKAGVEMPENLAQYLDTLYDTIDSQLEDFGFDSVEDMIRYDFGAGGTYDNYQEYMRIYYLGNEYYAQVYEALEFTDAQIEAYYDTHEEDLASAGCSKDNGSSVSVRHILIQPADDSEEAKASAYAQAALILNEWKSGEATEETFAELANTYSADDGSNTTGGLYTGITANTNFVTNFLNWCIDESRQVGDYGIVETEHGYHIMYFSGSELLWYEACRYYLASETMTEKVAAWEANYPLEVAYSKIALGEVALD